MRKATPVIIYHITYADGEEVRPPLPPPAPARARPHSLHIPSPRGSGLANDYPTLTLILTITPWTLGRARPLC